MLPSCFFFHCQDNMCVAGIIDPRLCSNLNSRPLCLCAHLITHGWACRPGTEARYVLVYLLNWVGCTQVMLIHAAEESYITSLKQLCRDNC